VKITSPKQSDLPDELRRQIPRKDLIEAWRDIEDHAKDLAKRLTGKEAATPSRTWNLLSSARPEMILFLAVTSRNQTVAQKIKNFLTKWRQVVRSETFRVSTSGQMSLPAPVRRRPPHKNTTHNTTRSRKSLQPGYNKRTILPGHSNHRHQSQQPTLAQHCTGPRRLDRKPA